MQGTSQTQLPIRHIGVAYVLVSQKLQAKDVELDMHSSYAAFRVEPTAKYLTTDLPRLLGMDRSKPRYSRCA